MKLHDYSRDFVGRCMLEQDAFGFLRMLCDEASPRLSGSAEEARATELVLERFAECGYETRNEELSYDGWRAGASRVAVREGAGERDLPSFPLGWCPGGEVAGTVADAGCGMEEDFVPDRVRGKVVLVSSETPAGRKPLHRSEKYSYAVAAGASGFVFYDRRPGGLPAMGTVSTEARMGCIPAVGISYEDAMRLRDRPEGTTIGISSTCTGERTISHNAIGLKRGAVAEEIVVCGHIDSWFSPGAVDNGSGVAMVAELARLLAPYALRRSVRFVSFGSEELGLLGSQAHVAARGDLSDIACVLNLDCSAIRDGSPAVATNDSPRLHELVTEVAGLLHLPLALSPETVRYSDHYSFRQKGVPGAAFASGSSLWGFAHTSCDTLDKICPEAFTVPLIAAGVVLIECAMRDVSFRPVKP